MPPPAATQAAARLWTTRLARCSFRKRCHQAEYINRQLVP